MQPQSNKNMYNRPSKAVRNSLQSRTNQTAAGYANRQQNLSNNTFRNRCTQQTVIFPTIQHRILMEQTNDYTTLPTTLQQCQYTPQFYPQMYYRYYVPYLPQQQQQPLTQQNGNVGSLMGVAAVQPGSFISGACANQTFIPFAINPTNSLLNVANTAASQTVCLSPLQQAQAPLQCGLTTMPNIYVLNVANSTTTVSSVITPPTRMTFAAAALAGNTCQMGPSQTSTRLPTKITQVKPKLRSHALQIIHPVTKKNILQDMNNDKELILPATATTSQTEITEKKVLTLLQEEMSTEYVKQLEDLKEKDSENCGRNGKGKSKKLADAELGLGQSSEELIIQASNTVSYKHNLEPIDCVGKAHINAECEDLKSLTNISSVVEELVAYNEVSKDLGNGKLNIFSGPKFNNYPLNILTNPTAAREQFELKEPSLKNFKVKENSTNPIIQKQYTREKLMQLRQAKQSCMQPNIKHCSIFAPVKLMPDFVVCSENNNIVRNAVGASGEHHNCNRGKPLIYLNLSINKEVKLNKADNAWKPKVLIDVKEKNLQPEKDDLIRRVRGILNKLTPENFEPLVEHIIKLKIDTLDKMEAVMNLIFEKAIDEPNFSVSYAKLCQRLIIEVQASDERMTRTTKTNLAYFRNALLNKTEREFTDHVIKINAKEEKLKPIREKYDQCLGSNKKIELKSLLQEEECKIRRRSGGTVRFIGELFKISILSGSIIHNCIEELLKHPNNEDMLECLCKLLTTVGQKFEQTFMSQKDKRKFSLKIIIKRMQNIARKSENSKISSRLRFMLQDVIDLRKNKWQSTHNNETPKTLDQIEREVNKTIQSNTSNAESAGVFSTNSLQNSKKNIKSQQQHAFRKNLETAQGQREVKRSNFSDIKSKRQQHIAQAADTSKLVGFTNVDMNNKKMGGASMFQWKKTTPQPATSNTNSFAVLSSIADNQATTFHDTERKRQRSGGQAKNFHNKTGQHRKNAKTITNPTSRSLQCTVRMPKATNPNKHQPDNTSKKPSSSLTLPAFKEPNNSELKLIKSVVNDMLENAHNSKSINSDTVACLRGLTDSLKSALINYLLTDYLHLANVKSLSRRLLANITAYLIENGHLTINHFKVAYNNFADLANDLFVDIPELWLYIFEFTGPLMVKDLITINDLWNKELKESSPSVFSMKFIKTLLLYSVREVGPNFTRNMWKKYHIKWSDFMPQIEVSTFIANNQFEFLENSRKPFKIVGNLKESPETLQKRVVEHLQQLLKETNNPEFIIDYINGNIEQVTTNFIHNLTTTLISYALRESKKYGLDFGKFKNVCLPILLRYLDSQKDLELECLHAIYRLIQNLEHPKRLWNTICAELTDNDIIAQETFIAWQNSKHQEQNYKK